MRGGWEAWMGVSMGVSLLLSDSISSSERSVLVAQDISAIYEVLERALLNQPSLRPEKVASAVMMALDLGLMQISCREAN